MSNVLVMFQADTENTEQMALAVGVGLSAVAEIFEEELTQLVGPRGKHRPDRRGGAPAWIAPAGEPATTVNTTTA